MLDNTPAAPGPLLPFAVIGDVHGRVESLAQGAAHAFDAGVSRLIQVGDYWLYESRYARLKVDRTLAALASGAGLDPASVELFFCDGNHEHFDVLDPDSSDPVVISEHVTYVPRGVAIDIAGYRVGFCGGAESIDRARRTAGVSWWPEERMSAAQIRRATNMGPLDVLITHDTSTAVFDQLTERSNHAWGKQTFGERERTAIDEILEATQPAWHAHGHHHTWGLFRTSPDSGTGTTTVSLAADARPGAAALLGRNSGAVHPSTGHRTCTECDLDLEVTPLP